MVTTLVSPRQAPWKAAPSASDDTRGWLSIQLDRENRPTRVRAVVADRVRVSYFDEVEGRTRIELHATSLDDLEQIVACLDAEAAATMLAAWSWRRALPPRLTLVRGGRA